MSQANEKMQNGAAYRCCSAGTKTSLSVAIAGRLACSARLVEERRRCGTALPSLRFEQCLYPALSDLGVVISGRRARAVKWGPAPDAPGGA